ncbi:response regulator transcription factor, partial [Anaerotignum sp.]|uniref:response regulator transcription factor n=1 Tax=Anaerotignum sp. TaxID=2039241 RepID=UPI002897E914
MNNMILLLEDDISLVDGLKYALKRNGFEVDFVRTVKEALSHLHTIEKYDLIILDVTLPDGSGYVVCEEIRKKGSSIPIIFLTASDEEVNVIRGLDCGGDDYITKPFRLGELCSRIRALLRRTGISNQNNTSILCGDISIDLLESCVRMNGKRLELTNGEYRLITLLVKNANRVTTREHILNELWDSTADFVDDNT